MTREPRLFKVEAMSDLLGFLTGRTTFTTPGFVAREAGHTSEAMDALRGYMGLLRTDTDWAVAAVLGAIEACYDLWPFLPEDPSMLACTWERDADVWSGAVLTPDSQGPPSMLFAPSYWPVDLDWVLSKYSDHQAILRGNHMHHVFAARADGNRLRVFWPEELGWKGDLVLGTTWGTADVLVRHLPVYPFAAVARGLAGRSEFPMVLQAGGMLEAWHSFNDPVRKVAAAGTALIRLAEKGPPVLLTGAPPPAARTDAPLTNS